MEAKEIIGKMEQKYKEAKELPPCDIKVILLGDSAVGKSKYVKFKIIIFNDLFVNLFDIGW